ncbi:MULTISPECIES: hypothetical protein [Halorussus]|uniref:hypothetical protein n=1 Tax=Halorussus TaxID=1070314 RepID=UPI00209D94FB|nr:hypothetical protein [Halorussus vallis]USZ77566.1 hypothetical protein NGM07_09570 [Halorussus vallis]
MVVDYDEEPLAVWEALLLPNCRWEAYEKTEENLYYGRVRSPNTFGRWEYVHFSTEQLKTVGGYRVDTSPGDDKLFPDGGYELTYVIETEFEAFQQSGDGIFGR